MTSWAVLVQKPHMEQYAWKVSVYKKENSLQHASVHMNVSGRHRQDSTERWAASISSAVVLSVLSVTHHQLWSRNIKQKIPEINNPQVFSSLPFKVTR